MIVLGGDYVTWGDRSYVGPCSEALAGLAAPFGVYAVVGNHDDDRDMPAALISHGYEVLRDARTTVRIRGEQLELVGLRFWTRRARDIARLIRGAESTVILLAHDPRRLDQAAALDVPLVLSGHTHGGQVVLPGLGAIAAKKFPVVAGAGRRKNTSIFVSRGVGTVYVPYRLNCPPDVSVITLKSKSVSRIGVSLRIPICCTFLLFSVITESIRRAVETIGHRVSGADAATDEDRRVSCVGRCRQSTGKFFAAIARQAGQHDLAAVCVARQHERRVQRRGLLETTRIVREQDGRRLGTAKQSGDIARAPRPEAQADKVKCSPRIRTVVRASLSTS